MSAPIPIPSLKGRVGVLKDVYFFFFSYGLPFQFGWHFVSKEQNLNRYLTAFEFLFVIKLQRVYRPRRQANQFNENCVSRWYSQFNGNERFKKCKDGEYL
jgi:hypothetical protein